MMYGHMALWAAKATIGTGNLVAKAGKKFIEVAVPTVKKASQISLTFIQGGINAVQDSSKQSSKVERIQLSESLDIVENGLSIPLSFSENQFKTFQQEVSNALNIIKGQNEMLFLSNSIAYFVESHATRTGIDRGISYALQYDIAAVKNYLKKSRDLRFPGYLLHQCTSLAETIKELNVFYTSLLQHGKVPHFTKEDVEEELQKRYGASQRKGEIRSYIPYELQLPFLRNYADEKKKNVSILNIFFGDNSTINLDEINDIAHEALFILSEELIANEELEHRVYKFLKHIPEQKLLVESYTEGIHTSKDEEKVE